MFPVHEASAALPGKAEAASSAWAQSLVDAELHFLSTETGLWLCENSLKRLLLKPPAGFTGGMQ
jgi:hypothetical protein